MLTGCITFAGNLFSASVHSPHSFEMEVVPPYLHTGLLYSSEKTIRMKGLEGRAARANRGLRPLVTDFGSTK